MDCDQSSQLLDACVDGELDVAHSLEMEAHLRACPACAQAAANIRAGREAIHAALPRYKLPEGLEQTLLARYSNRTEGAARPTSRRSWFTPAFGNALGLAASIALVLSLGFAWGQAQARSHMLVEEAATGHLRSLQAGHLMDVVSTDNHTVKPWFAGKLAFSPPVADYASIGFPLLGGRLDQIDHEVAAVLVYGRRLHRINLYIWPSSAQTLSDMHSEDLGCHVAAWSSSGLNFLAVSDVAASDLDQFSKAVRSSPP